MKTWFEVHDQTSENVFCHHYAGHSPLYIRLNSKSTMDTVIADLLGIQLINKYLTYGSLCYLMSFTSHPCISYYNIHCPTKGIRTPPNIHVVNRLNIQLGAKMGIEIYRYQRVVVLVLTLVEIFIIFGIP